MTTTTNSETNATKYNPTYPIPEATKAPINLQNNIGTHSQTPWLKSSTTLLTHPATLLHSPITGLRGLVVTTPEPLCSLHILVATCATTTSTDHRDDGLPHTLEHTVFLGSERYPYKGILDKLANRSLADGTNAWTATDHTAYTLTTAGEEGVLNLLPVYADHVLYPTMTPEGFRTEIHHVTKEGTDKGVVYCEMQGRENTEESLVDRALMDLLYPHGCGYSSETGGKLENLRRVGHDGVRRYHRDNYRPDNIMFVLSGNVDAEKFFRALDEVEAHVRHKQRGEETKEQEETSERPWVNCPVPPMDLTMEGVIPPTTTTNTTKIPKPKEILFPSEDESRGTISIGWRAPPYSSRTTRFRLSLLWTYLTESATSPLQKAFVECDEPLCADVSPAHEVFTEGYMQLWFMEVEVERMDEVVPRLIATLENVVGHGRTERGDDEEKEKEAEEDKFDMERMKMVIRRERRRSLEYNERRPTYAMIDSVVRNFLYAPRHSDDGNVADDKFDTVLDNEICDLISDVDERPLLLDALENTTEDTWTGLLHDYILSKPYGLVFGRPSADLAASIARDEAEREEKQALELGEEKLNKLGEELEAAIAFHERDIPEEILTETVPVPSLSKVKAVPVSTMRGSVGVAGVGDPIAFAEKGESGGCGDGGGSVEAEAVLMKLNQSAKDYAENHQSPGVGSYYVDLNHIESAFLTVAVSLSTKELTQAQRLYIPLLLELAFKLPATLDDGFTMTKDEFVSQLQDDTVSYGAHHGVPGCGATQALTFTIQMENPGGKGFDPAMTWLRRVLYQTVLSTETLKIAASRLLSEIPPQIRSGPTICDAVSIELNYDGSVCDRTAVLALRQLPFLTGIVKRMEDENDVSVLEEIVAVRETLVQTKNMQIFVAGNLKEIPEPVPTLFRYLIPPSPLGSSTDVTTDTNDPEANGTLIHNLSSLTVLSNKVGQGAVCSLSAIESSFVNIACPGLEAYDPDQAPLLVAIEYLTALEGDFWVKLRGAGLTYGSSIQNSTESKMLKFSLYKCGDVTGAYEASVQILTEYASGASTVSSVGISSAKSSLAYNVVSRTSTPLAAAKKAFAGNYESRRKKVDYDQWLLREIGEVTVDDVMRALVKYLIPLFSPSSNLIVTCPSNKSKEIKDFFVSKGWVDVRLVLEDKLCEVFATGDGCEEKE